MAANNVVDVDEETVSTEQADNSMSFLTKMLTKDTLVSMM